MGVHDIGWAVDQIKAGYAVRRPHWGECFSVYMQHIKVLASAGMLGPIYQTVELLVISMPSLNRVQPFTCHHDDLLATDWELA